MTFPKPHPPNPDDPEDVLYTVDLLDNGEIAELFVDPGRPESPAATRRAGGSPATRLPPSFVLDGEKRMDGGQRPARPSASSAHPLEPRGDRRHGRLQQEVVAGQRDLADEHDGQVGRAVAVGVALDDRVAVVVLVAELRPRAR